MRGRLRMVQAEFECEPQTIDTWLGVTIDNPDVDIGHVQNIAQFFSGVIFFETEHFKQKTVSVRCACVMRMLVRQISKFTFIIIIE